MALRLVLVAVFIGLAWAAHVRGSELLAGLAIADLAVLLTLDRKRQGLFAMAGLVAGLAFAAFVARHGHALVLLRLVPPLCLALASRTFARTLLPGRSPLVVRMVSLVEGVPLPQLDAPTRRYAVGVTWFWAVLLAVLAIVHLALGMLMVPGGVLAHFGFRPALGVSEAWANRGVVWGVEGPVGLGMLGEFALRRHLFPERYGDLGEFIAKLRRVPASAWRSVF